MVDSSTRSSRPTRQVSLEIPVTVVFPAMKQVCLVLLTVLVFLSALCSGPAWGEDAPKAPFNLPTPEGWRTEVLPFPLEFAPELFDRGMEELRFAPGMFEEADEDFWTYSFVWWLPAETEIEPEQIATDLIVYFRGLATAVAEDKNLEMGKSIFDAQMDVVGSHVSAFDFEGTATTFDSFVTGESVVLNIRVKVVLCALQGHFAIVFELSPQPTSHEVWQTLGQIRDDFRCTP